MNAAPSLITKELSESWPLRLAGKIPDFVDVFCLIGIDPTTERYVGWGFYESTSEPPGWSSKCGGHVFVLASVRVPLRERSDDGLKGALKEACVLLSKTVWKSQEPAYVRVRNKLAEDLAFWQNERDAGRGSGLVVEHVDSRELAELLRQSRDVSV